MVTLVPRLCLSDPVEIVGMPMSEPGLLRRPANADASLMELVGTSEILRFRPDRPPKSGADVGSVSICSSYRFRILISGMESLWIALLVSCGVRVIQKWDLCCTFPSTSRHTFPSNMSVGTPVPAVPAAPAAPATPIGWVRRGSRFSKDGVTLQSSQMSDFLAFKDGCYYFHVALPSDGCTYYLATSKHEGHQLQRMYVDTSDQVGFGLKSLYANKEVLHIGIAPRADTFTHSTRIDTGEVVYYMWSKRLDGSYQIFDFYVEASIPVIRRISPHTNTITKQRLGIKVKLPISASYKQFVIETNKLLSPTIQIKTICHITRGLLFSHRCVVKNESPSEVEMPESVRWAKLFIGAPVEVAEDTTLPSSMRHMSAITEKFHATRELAMYQEQNVAHDIRQTLVSALAAADTAVATTGAAVILSSNAYKRHRAEYAQAADEVAAKMRLNSPAAAAGKSNEDDEECVLTGERSLEERNILGFSPGNVIVVD